MRGPVGAIIGMAILAFGAYAAYCAWIAFGTSARPAYPFTYTAECDKIPVHSNAFKGAPYACQMRLYEAELLRRAPGLAVRDGDNLTLSYHGKVTHQLVPALPDGKEACDDYNIRNVAKLFDSVSQKLETLADVTCHYGEFDSRFLAMPDGSRWQHPTGVLSASPNGKLIALGDAGPYRGAAGLHIYEWPSRQTIAQFTPNCRVLAWQDETDLTAACLMKLPDTPLSDMDLLPDVFANYVAFDAKVWRDESGRWQMQATRCLQPREPHLTRDNEFDYAPAFSLRWLPHFTAMAG